MTRRVKIRAFIFNDANQNVPSINLPCDRLKQNHGKSWAEPRSSINEVMCLNPGTGCLVDIFRFILFEIYSGKSYIRFMIVFDDSRLIQTKQLPSGLLKSPTL